MTRIELAPEVLDDWDRFIEHMSASMWATFSQDWMRSFERSSDRAIERSSDRAIDILAHSPAIGRPVKGGKRELLLGRG